MARPRQPTTRRRVSKRSTDQRLLDTAEALFARRGLEGVSLREISAAAGSANSVAVQYHFGTKQGLVEAIFERRLTEIDGRRAELLNQAKRDGSLNDPRAMVAIMLRPTFEQQDSDGYHTYAAFLMRLYQGGSDDPRRLFSHLTPLTDYINEHLRSLLPTQPRRLFNTRIFAGSLMFLSMLVAKDMRQRHTLQSVDDDVFFAECVNLVLSCLCAPVLPEVEAALPDFGERDVVVNEPDPSKRS